MLWVLYLGLFLTLVVALPHWLLEPPSEWERRYASFPTHLRVQMAEQARDMFYYGYDNYMKYAFPFDELDPIHCTGRGPDVLNPSNININDVLGGYSLTLVESLGTLAILGNATEFHKAVRLVVDTVSFHKDYTVQVFEVTIRILGSLLSAHLLIEDPRQPFGPLKPPWYEGELLDMAHDLATRITPAFQLSTTGIPYPRVNLRHGVPSTDLNETCTAGAGSLLLEMGTLSRLLGDPTYEAYARKAVRTLWELRGSTTGLLGNVVDSQTGKWVGCLSGVGAGLDSFYEYLFKAHMLFGEDEDLYMFNQSYTNIRKFLRRGRVKCNEGSGDHPLYVNVEMSTGLTHTTWIDALQASFPAVQVLFGDVEEAICHHALYYFLWKRYNVLPERFNWQKGIPDLSFYPLRPELVEATYFLYQATRNVFYLHVGRDILSSLEQHTKTNCGYATVHNVNDMSLEDRMESFFLSETCKYLILLFDEDNHVNQQFASYVFTTEGHLLPVSVRHRGRSVMYQTFQSNNSGTSNMKCDKVDDERRYSLPLRSRYLAQLNHALGMAQL